MKASNASLVAGVAVVLAAGCGSGDKTGTAGSSTRQQPATTTNPPVTSAPRKGDPTHGRSLFVNGAAPGRPSCGFCHTMRSAGTDGPFAPNLDTILSGDRSSGMTTEQIRRVVLDQIAHPACGDPHDPARCMPANLVTGDDAADVAAFVADCAGVAGTNSRPTTPACRPSEAVRKIRGEAAAGERLYARLGCPSCHFSGRGAPIGPPLVGVYRSKVALANGKTVTADERYLLRSILAPDAQTVAGYQKGLMISRIKAERITPAQAKALVAFIKTLK